MVKIPQIEPWIDEQELQQLARVIASTYVVEHDLTAEFESMTRKLTGADFAIAVCNGTAALFICLKALGIGPGDEVIVPDLTFIATANAVIMAGAIPVFCDVDKKTLGLDLNKAELLINKKTRALVPVHLYGQSVDMHLLKEFAALHSLKVIEDAAQGVGVRFSGQHVGTFGDFGILSYYGNKTITTGEGGVILTNDPELARAAYRLKNHGRDKKGVFVHDHIGFNFSFTEMQAAIGISQMNKLSAIVEKKQVIRDRYERELADIAGLEPISIDDRCQPVFWFTSFWVENKYALIEHLANIGIQTRQFFLPLHRQPCYLGNSLVKNTDGDFPVSENAFEQGLSLPSSYCLTYSDQSEVIAGIRGFYENRD